jgi:hypothetical protein
VVVEAAGLMEQATKLVVQAVLALLFFNIT